MVEWRIGNNLEREGRHLTEIPLLNFTGGTEKEHKIWHLAVADVLKDRSAAETSVTVYQ